MTGADLFTSVQDLEAWKPQIGHDRYGDFHFITMYEGTGVCFWCGGELTGKATRYCKKEHHWKLYVQHFCWTWAAPWCLQRYEYQCANCGKSGRSLEVHHIVPLNGEERLWTPYNMPWNLITFCHQCHLDVAAAMKPRKLTGWEMDRLKKMEAGQLELFEGKEGESWVDVPILQKN